jgi:cyclase
MKQVSANAYMSITGRGCNVGLVVTSEGIVMIDTPFMPGDAEALRREIEPLGKVVYIIQTEPHLDHISGGGFFEGTVVSQEATREAFFASLGMARQAIAQQDPEHLALWESRQPRPPAITFAERLTLRLGQHTFHLMRLPGHTAGETAVFVPEERVVFTGDNVVNAVPPFLHQAYPDHWVQSLKTISELDVDKIAGGHGDVADKSVLPGLSAFISDYKAAVRQAIDRGLSKEEITSTVSLMDRFNLPAATANRGFDLGRMASSRLYDVLTQGEDALLAEGR